MANELAMDTYVRAKQDVARLLRALQQLVLQRHGQAGAEAVRQLTVRLAEDRFNLVVLGQFKRGKSSLMNAVIGQELLPTAAVPLTSAVTKLHYGPELRIQIWHEGWVLPRQIPAMALSEYITERGNPGNEKQVLSAEIAVPAPFLRRGLHFVDTPGIGSVHRHNTATTYRFLPEADAVIFVTSAESPFSDAEAELLDAIREHVRKVFFVLNKVDQLAPQEQAEVVAFLTPRLAERLQASAVRLYALSARQALEAKRTRDAALLRSSGLAAFEQQLADFLAGERGQLLLVSILDRALRLLQEEQKQADVRAQAFRRSPAERAQQVAALRQRWPEITAQQRAVVERAQEGADDFLRDTIAPALVAFAERTGAALTAQLPTLLADHREQDIEVSYPHVRRLIAAAMLERTQAWLEDQIPQIGEALQQQVATLRAACQAMLDRVAAIITETLQLPPDTAPTLELPAGSEEVPGQFVSRFELPSPDVNAVPFFPVPRRWAQHLLLRHLEKDLQADLQRATAALEQAISSVLSVPIQRIERAAADMAEQARRQIETALLGTGPDSAPSTQPDALASLVAEVTALRDRILGWDTKAIAAPDESEGAVAPSDDGVSGELARGWDAPAHGDAGIRCRVCTASHDAAYDFLVDWQYRLAHDRETQRDFADAGGFCSLHTWQLEDVASPRGLSEGYIAVLDRFVHELRDFAGLPSRQAAQRLAATLPDATRCQVCVVVRQAEERAWQQIITALGARSTVDTDSPMASLCLPHLHALLRHDPSDEATSALVAALAYHLEATSTALNGFALKFDALRRELWTPEEEHAAQQALILLAGHPPGP